MDFKVTKNSRGYDLEIDGKPNAIRKFTIENLEKRFGVRKWIAPLYEKVKASPDTDAINFTYDERAENEVVFFTRGIRDTMDKADRHPRFPHKIDYNFVEPVIEWNSDHCICLDIDGCPVFDWNFTTTVRPALSWKSHGGGYHLIFFTDENWTAMDRAAVAAFEVLTKEPYLKVEFKKGTRHPKGERNGQKCGGVFEHTQSSDLTIAQRLFYEESKEAIEDSEKWETGTRHPHTECPFSPYPTSGNDPVYVMPNGLYCHVCQRTKSWGGKKLSVIHDMVRNFVHWGHARLAFQHSFKMDARVMEKVYEVLLRLVHGNDDYRVSRAFAVPNLVFWEGGWGDLEGYYYSRNSSKHVLTTLPCCRTKDDKIIAGKADMFSESLRSVKDSGYFPLRRLLGAKIYGHHNKEMTDCIPVSIYPDLPEERHPRYLGKDRMPKEDAWKILEKPFPGLNRKLIELLILAKGCKESRRQAVPPIIFLTGPTSSGKSMSAKIASAMMGEVPTECVWSKDEERVRQQLMFANTSGSFAIFNEMFKVAKSAKVNVIDAANFLFNLTERSVSHVLFKGPTQLLFVPVTIVTDTDIDQEILNDAQLGRRIIHVPLSSEVNLIQSVQDHIGRVEDLRKRNYEYCIASDSIVSHIIDDHFTDPNVFFFEQARLLGFETIRERNKENRQQLMREFYDRYLQIASTQEWVAVDGPPLETMYCELGGRRQLNGEDWKPIVGVSGRFVEKTLSGRRVIRFENGEVKG